MNLAAELERIGASKVVHVGAHRAQEAETYAAVDASVIWIEADPRLADDLHERLRGFRGQWSIIACCDATPGLRRFYRASNDGESSSLLEFAAHLDCAPDIQTVGFVSLPCVELDAFGLDPDWLTLDVQGAELRVLMGATYTLRSVRAVWAEVSNVELYDGGVQYDVLTDWMTDAGFVLVDVDWSMFDGHHGDALYERRS